MPPVTPAMVRRTAGPVGGPKKRALRTAVGRAPIAKTSRRMPPTPVAAPWYGSIAPGDGISAKSSGLGGLGGADELVDLVGEGGEIVHPGLDLAVDLVDVGLLAVVGEQVSQICEVLEAVRERSLHDPVLGDCVEDVVIGLGFGERERRHEVRAGAEEKLDRLLQVPLREAVELRVGLELGVLDRAEIVEEHRVLAQPGQASAHVLDVYRETIALGPLGERLRLDL